MTETTTTTPLGLIVFGDQRRSPVAQCILNAARMMECDADRGQAALLRQAAQIVDDMLAALKSADEWMACVEPHLIDGQPYKRDRAMIRAAIRKATGD